ncbi:hypothetical protein [Maritimibacter sp. HL-12]|jgi:hypothetical protein|uniref:hypothetical protein n=1 Tax=Maritimibacter sp. HL-12 TaxID=1162418 RepID=UPI000A0F356B|nr:hypothetical protein [Maritimibacter sp. HL-12]SMH57528.1 hypothetical protein SAMN05661107_3438 [Maritimibacter sp. HL-12]
MSDQVVGAAQTPSRRRQETDRDEALAVLSEAGLPIGPGVEARITPGDRINTLRRTRAAKPILTK